MPEVQNFKLEASWFATDTIGTPRRKVGSRCRRLHFPVDRVDSPNTCYHRSIINYATSLLVEIFLRYGIPRQRYCHPLGLP
jgi:hypothetical protein